MSFEEFGAGRGGGVPGERQGAAVVVHGGGEDAEEEDVGHHDDQAGDQESQDGHEDEVVEGVLDVLEGVV